MYNIIMVTRVFIYSRKIHRPNQICKKKICETHKKGDL